ncbi:MAG TPA: hypothetical protein VHP83_23650 [Aggregatilineaceae bacterium]|nr:hypothetical protein [Aggregatilineaceae bacterium]
MQERIKEALSVLIGLPLYDAGRASDLEWFHFGSQRTITYPRGTKTVGEYALHVQCSWRIATTEQVIVASRDLYYPPNNDRNIPDDFDWDVHMGNRHDQRMALFLENLVSAPLRVAVIEVGLAGNLKLFFSGTCALEIFPDDSFTDSSSEHWRFFRPGDIKNHFVVTGFGIE